MKCDLKTKNGKKIYTEDLRKTFGILKALLKKWGYDSNVKMEDTPPNKAEAEMLIKDLFEEYADNEYRTTVERKFQLEEEQEKKCNCNKGAKTEEIDVMLQIEKRTSPLLILIVFAAGFVAGALLKAVLS